MNWKQLYTSATPEERIELYMLMFQTIEARQNKLILAKGRLIHERRDPFPKFHRVGGERRSSIPLWKRSMIKTARHISIVLSVGALTGGVATVALSVSTVQGLVTVLAYEVAVVALLYFKPKKRAFILA